MKKLLISLLLVVTTVMSANAMSTYRASREARFLTDKMAWELDLTPMQIEDVYEINYDYFRCLVSVHSNYTREYEIRNEELRFVLTPWQWDRFIAREYFYIPVRIVSYAWNFAIYNYYRRDHFYYDAPHAYSHYRGGHAMNRVYYSGRRDIHHPGGNYRPAPAPKPEPKHENRPNYRPNGSGNGNMNGNKNGNVAPNNNRNSNRSGNNNTVAPNKSNRTTPNRSGSASKSTESRSNSRNSSARPTRSQQNSGSHSATTGRR